MRKIISVIMAVLIMATSFSSIVSAEDPNYGVAPCWENMSNVFVTIGFTGTNGTASVTVDRIFGITTSLEATLTVYKKEGNSWVYVTSISGTSSRQLNLEVDFTAVTGATYKAEADVTAYGTAGSDTDTISELGTCS